MEPIITIPGLENSDVVTRTPMQEALAPYVPELMVFWWGVWAVTFLYVAGKYVVLPLLRK